MPVYLWTGKNRSDVTKKGEIEAVSEEAVKAQLIRQKITPTKIFDHDRCRFADYSVP